MKGKLVGDLRSCMHAQKPTDMHMQSSYHKPHKECTIIIQMQLRIVYSIIILFKWVESFLNVEVHEYSHH